MPSFGPTPLNYKALNGNAVTVMLGEQVIGFAQTVNPVADFGTQTLYGIGSANPQEIQQLRNQPSVSVDNFMLTPEGLNALGQPSTMLEVLSNNQFNFHLLDRTGEPLLTYVGCVANSQNINVSANEIITEATTFSALDILNPLGESIFSAGNNALTQAAYIGAALSALGV